ncbi:hypothetical protein WJX77_008107 [Trebouxia sp. C0004]
MHWGLVVVTKLQTDDKWLATTYNSLPECGGKELLQKARTAMAGFKWYGRQAATFTTEEPIVVICAKQQNCHDCGMCLAGFALTVVLGLAINSAPAECPSQLLARWHDAIEAGFRDQRLDKTFLA